MDWEPFVPALAFTYNTSYHRLVKATPFSLTFGLEAQLPAFFASDIDRLHDGSEAGSHLARRGLSTRHREQPGSN